MCLFSALMRMTPAFKALSEKHSCQDETQVNDSDVIDLKGSIFSDTERHIKNPDLSNPVVSCFFVF